MLFFAVQDALSKHLVSHHSVFLITAIRYWFMAALAVFLASRQPGGLRHTIRSSRLSLQLLRGVLLAAEICLIVTSFVLLGLIETHAIFAVAPLLVVAFSGPLLGEKVGWQRWLAIAAGFVGVLVILRPGFGVFSPYGLIAVAACLVFAAYVLLTRLVSRDDSSATSFFWTSIVGMVVLTPIGLWNWHPLSGQEVVVLTLLCIVAGTAHYLFISAYAVAEASIVQPFSYLQLVFVTILAVVFFGEQLQLHTAIGALAVVSSGLFVISRKPTRKPR
ncbi:DMT family transporter [Denitrobaculum tricleocarpae]|uniref:DMT family transporter n=2 Tax=Denitrobaculum tricleocarpae TaxID=2591009 RepID=A0A545U3I3_9PROT|nr:DMT family transporter [Denitrobaculum tricleocarpae]